MEGHRCEGFKSARKQGKGFLAVDQCDDAPDVLGVSLEDPLELGDRLQEIGVHLGNCCSERCRIHSRGGEGRAPEITV